MFGHRSHNSAGALFLVSQSALALSVGPAGTYSTCFVYESLVCDLCVPLAEWSYPSFLKQAASFVTCMRAPCHVPLYVPPLSQRLNDELTFYFTLKKNRQSSKHAVLRHTNAPNGEKGHFQIMLGFCSSPKDRSSCEWAPEPLLKYEGR